MAKSTIFTQKYNHHRAGIMHRRVRKYIEQKNLLAEDDKIIVALSGGADSVALLHILAKLEYNIEAVHCNFHLRDEESVRDEEFVRGLCEKMGVKLTVTHFDTAAYATKKRISIEMAARELRYDFFESIRKKSNAAAIAVAHHRDDVAETMILNLMRGTGIKGLHGIMAKNGNIIRPLLGCSKQEIIDYLQNIGEEFVTDSSNLKNDYTRNKIRLEIIPLMRKINPSICATLAETAERIAEAEKVYDKGICEGKAHILINNGINIDRLLEEPSPLALLHETLHPLGFNSTQCEKILLNIKSGESGKIYNSHTHSVSRNRNRLLILPTEANNPATVNEELIIGNKVTTDCGEITMEKLSFDGVIAKSRNTAMLDCEKIKFPLRLRNIKAGDRFRPYGMRGSKLVSDYLTDCKKSLHEKRQQLVVTDDNDTVVWLVGERIAAPYAVGTGTAHIIKLTWEPE